MTNVTTITQFETKKIQEVLERSSLSSTVQLTGSEMIQITETQIGNYKKLLKLIEATNEKSDQKLQEIDKLFEKTSDIKKRLLSLQDKMQKTLPVEVTGHYSMTKGL